MKQPQKQTHITILHSDAQVDQHCYDQLTIHLSQLQREGLIKQWSDRQILAGSDRSQAIDEAIRSADILLLLISVDFLASDTCYLDEMKQALERHKRGETRIIPLIVRPCDWSHSFFGSLRYLPRNGEPISTWDNQDKAFLSVVEDLRVLITQQQFPPPPLSRMPRQNRERLLKSVRDIWITGLLDQSLHQATWLDLHLQDQPDALKNPWRLEVQELNRRPRPLPIGTSIVQVYNEADGKLLILGEPGSGKTTLLLHLARTLLDYAEADERYPTPVVFNLSSWAERRQSLQKWLVEELWTKYQVPRRVGKAWIETDQVLLLLDGLDEVAKEARSACIKEINDYYQSRLERGSSPIVVCCRSKEYAAFSTRVMFQHAVSIQPLSDEQINTYLEQAGEQVGALRKSLEEDVELRSLVRQPLMLNVFTLAYQGARPSEVPTGETREEAQHIVFARYVECMLKRRKQSKRWEPEQVIRWLTFLAKQMQRHNQTIFSVDGLQPDWLPSPHRRKYRWSLKLVVGLLFGLLFGLPSQSIIGLLAGMGFGLIAGGLVPMRDRGRIQPTEVINWVWKDRHGRLVVGLFVVLFVGLSFGLFVTLLSGLSIGLLGGLSVGLVAVGLVLEKDKDRVRPTEVISWKWTEMRWIFLVILFGVPLSGLLFMLLNELINGLLVGLLLLFLLVGLFAELFTGLFMKRLTKREDLTPNEVIRRSGKNGLLFGLSTGLVIGLVAGLLPDMGPSIGPDNELFSGWSFGLKAGLDIRLVSGLFAWLLIGLLIGLFTGLDAFIQHFVLRFWLRRTKYLPWNLVPFLDEVTDQLLLRKIGGSYIFVHRLLLDYFDKLDGSEFTQHPFSDGRKRE